MLDNSLDLTHAFDTTLTIVNNTDMEVAQKELLREQINFLKKKKIIRFDADVAKDLDYTKGAVSEMLSLTSNKPVTYAFEQKFKEYYGKHFENTPVTETSDIRELKAIVEVLKQTCVEILSKTTGKSGALIAAELDEAIKIKLQ